MNKMPDNFPLLPKDRNGNPIAVGDTVKILDIPAWLTHDLDEESKQVVNSCNGKNMIICEIDSYGFAWVETVTLSTDIEYKSNNFCMEPNNLLKL
jgi:hypothetical protein